MNDHAMVISVLGFVVLSIVGAACEAAFILVTIYLFRGLIRKWLQ